ncbi:MAG: transposase [Croceibacterium sp.]
MPRVIELAGEADPCAPAECIAALHETGFEPREEDSLLHAAHWLRRLGRNRDFLADIMLGELKGRHREDAAAGGYGPQVIMLSALGGEFFLRANIWPSRDEHLYRASGGGAFAYGLPHDHDFDFLTYGYFGPGYWSDYWEYDYEAVAGALGEAAGLRFTGRSRLEPGRIMHYRAHRDVHSQLPPDSLSVSLNVMHASGAQGWLDQYRFDVERGKVAGVLGAPASQVFLRVAVGLGNEDALDLAETFAGSHPSDRIRLAALEAQAGVLARAARDDLWRRAERAGSRLVALEARRQREGLAAARPASGMASEPPASVRGRLFPA